MQAGIQEGVKPQQFAEGQHLPETKYGVERGAGQGENQQRQGGFAGAEGDLLDGVGGQLVLRKIPD